MPCSHVCTLASFVLCASHLCTLDWALGVWCLLIKMCAARSHCAVGPGSACPGYACMTVILQAEIHFPSGNTCTLVVMILGPYPKKYNSNHSTRLPFATSNSFAFFPLAD